LLDAGLLEETISSLISQGKRNFAIGLAGLDYIYSDAMNKFFIINRTVLDVSGRLALLSPSPEVRAILDKSGISNFLKIYNTDDELARSSHEIIKQTATIDKNDLMAQGGQQPAMSEFDELRSEIGSALTADIELPPRPASQPGFAKPPQFETMMPPGPQIPPASKIPPFQAPPMPSQQDSFAAQRPMYPSAQPMQAPAYKAPDFGMPAGDNSGVDQSGYRNMNAGQPQQPIGGQRLRESTPGFKPVESAASQKPATKQFPSADQEASLQDISRDKESRFRDFIEEDHKKFPVGIIFALIAVIILAGGGFAVFTLMKPGAGEKKPEIAQSMPQQVQPATPAVPQVAVEEPVKEVPTEPVAQVPVEPQKEVVETAPVSPKPTAAKTPVQRKPVKQTPQVKAPKQTIAGGPSAAEIEAARQRVLESQQAEEQEQLEATAAREAAAKLAAQKEEAAAEKAASVAAKAAADREASERVAAEKAAAAEREAAAAKVAAKVAAAAEPAVGGGEGGEIGTIFIATIPPVAEVYMDGKLLGKSNVDELSVTSGTHSMKFVKAGKEFSKEMSFKPGKNPSQMIKIQ
jgi:anti-anti-sigma factor